MYKFLLGIAFLFLPFLSQAQKIILVDNLMDNSVLGLKSYTGDSLVFGANQKIWGLVHYRNSIEKNPTVNLQFKNAYGLERTVRFKLKSFDPSQWNWDASILFFVESLFQKKDWYYLVLTDYPSVDDAYQGVAFLEIFEDIFNKNKQRLAIEPLYYKLEKEENFRTCYLDFETGKGYLVPLLKQMKEYKNMMAKRTKLKKEQLTIEKKCLPAGFEQVARWGTAKVSLDSALVEDDFQLFLAIEKMKIKTEESASKLLTEEKRLLRELFLLDIAILENSSDYERFKLRKRRSDLYHKLLLYPRLKPLLGQYQKLTNRPQNIKIEERVQQKKVQRIVKKMQLYSAQWNAHKALDIQIKGLEKQLEIF